MLKGGVRSVGLGAVLATTLAVALSGCAAFDAHEASADGVLRVVAGLYPLQWVTQQVAGNLVKVEDLTQPGQEPHDLELSPRQTADVADADLVVYERGLQAAVDSAVDQTATGTLLDVGKVARLEPMDHAGHNDTNHNDTNHNDTGHQDPGGAQDEEAEESHVSMDDLDPHFWQDPLRMADVADAVAAKLSHVDPGHAATYRKNAADTVAKLRVLDADYRTGLADCERDTIVVSHDAFGYLDRYGLDVEPIAGLSPDAEPTPADLVRLSKLIRSDGVTTVFGERLVPQELASTLADDMHVTTAVLDPIEGLSSQTAHDDYLSLMRANLAALRKANACQ